jgi:hypothetical protein
MRSENVKELGFQVCQRISLTVMENNISIYIHVPPNTFPGRRKSAILDK